MEKEIIKNVISKVDLKSTDPEQVYELVSEVIKQLEQNKNFVDHYLGVAFDLSDVFFIANCNTLDTIPGPLRDRLEIIEVSGYSEEEKLIIANQYLVPKQLKESGLSDADVVFSRNSITTIINSYTRESGLRGLEKQIASVCRKIARQYAEEEATPTRRLTIKMTPQLVEKHLGAKRRLPWSCLH